MTGLIPSIRVSFPKMGRLSPPNRMFCHGWPFPSYGDLHASFTRPRLQRLCDHPGVDGDSDLGADARDCRGAARRASLSNLLRLSRLLSRWQTARPLLRKTP